MDAELCNLNSLWSEPLTEEELQGIVDTARMGTPVRPQEPSRTQQGDGTAHKHAEGAEDQEAPPALTMAEVVDLVVAYGRAEDLLPIVKAQAMKERQEWRVNLDGSRSFGPRLAKGGEAIVDGDTGEQQVTLPDGKAPSRFYGDAIGGVSFSPTSTAEPFFLDILRTDSRLNAGIQTRVWKTVDCDLCNAEKVTEIVTLARQMFGDVSVRTRTGSPRVSIIVECIEELRKQVVSFGELGKVEILGNGQQTVLHGTHKSGAAVTWDGKRPPRVIIAQVEEFISKLCSAEMGGAQIGAREKDDKDGAAKVESSKSYVRGESCDDVERLLCEVPNNLDRDGWVKVALAAKWEGVPFEAFDAWSRKHPTYDEAETRRVWSTAKPAGEITGKSIFHMLGQPSRQTWESKGFKTRATKPGQDEPAVPGMGAACDAAARSNEHSQKQEHLNGSSAGADNSDGAPPNVSGHEDLTHEEERGALAMDDTGNATVLANITKGNLRYVRETGEWIWWNGKRWMRDQAGISLEKQVLRVARWWKKQAAFEYAMLGKIDLKKDKEAYDKQLVLAQQTAAWHKQCRNQSIKERMLKKAQVHETIAISLTELDTHKHLLGVENGVVNLRTGELLPDARDWFITRHCTEEFDPNARAPRWEQFIKEVTGLPGASRDQWDPQLDVEKYVRLQLGYCITGEVREHKGFFWYGGGGNGKGVMALDTVRPILGSYAYISPAGLLSSKRNPDPNSPSPAMRGLAGVRIAFVNELQDGDKLNQAMFKILTGGDTITARDLHQRLFTFEPTHKLLILTNDRPEIDKLDDATEGRIHMVAFMRQWNRPGAVEHHPTWPNADPALGETLKAERKGILAWLVRAAVDYYREGLKPPPEVVQATKEYFKENDAFALWLELCDRCELDEGTGPTAALLNYRNWCELEGKSPGKAGRSATAFGRSMDTANIEKGKATDGSRRYGIQVPQSEQF